MVLLKQCLIHWIESTYLCDATVMYSLRKNFNNTVEERHRRAVATAAVQLSTTNVHSTRSVLTRAQSQPERAGAASGSHGLDGSVQYTNGNTFVTWLFCTWTAWLSDKHSCTKCTAWVRMCTWLFSSNVRFSVLSLKNFVKAACMSDKSDSVTLFSNGLRPLNRPRVTSLIVSLEVSSDVCTVWRLF